MKGVGGFLGVPKLVVRGSEDCGADVAGGSSGAVDTGLGTASLEERAAVAIRDFLLIGIALGRGVGSLGGWVACSGSGSVVSASISAASETTSSRGSSADVRGTKGSKALADTLEVRAFVFGGLSGESDSNSRTWVRFSFHCTALRAADFSLCAFSATTVLVGSSVESCNGTTSSPRFNSLA